MTVANDDAVPNFLPPPNTLVRTLYGVRVHVAAPFSGHCLSLTRCGKDAVCLHVPKAPKGTLMHPALLGTPNLCAVCVTSWGIATGNER